MKSFFFAMATLLSVSAVGCADGALELQDEVSPASPQAVPEVPQQEETPGGKADEVTESDCPDTLALPAPTPATLSGTTRITSMRIPTSRNEAVSFGCDLVAGTTGGIGLSALATALQLDVDALVKPDATGFIPSILLGHLDGWTPGQTGNSTDALSFRLYTGIQEGGGVFSIDPISYVSSGQVRVEWPAHVGCGRLETEPGPLVFDLPAETSGLAASLDIASSRVSAAVNVTSRGVSIIEGTLVGYVPEANIVSIVEAIQASCRVPDAPELCESTNTFLVGDPVTITRNIVLPFLHGLDARLSDNGRRVDSCSGESCNALSVCVRIEGEATTVVP